MTNLENCPFCGGRDIKIYGSLGIGHHAACISCGLQAPTETGVTADQATAYWNTRAASRPAQEPVVCWWPACEDEIDCMNGCKPRPVAPRVSLSGEKSTKVCGIDLDPEPPVTTFTVESAEGK